MERRLCSWSDNVLEVNSKETSVLRSRPQAIRSAQGECFLIERVWAWGDVMRKGTAVPHDLVAVRRSGNHIWKKEVLTDGWKIP